MERWETQLVRGGWYKITDEVNRQCEDGWEPVGYSVAVDATQCEHFVLMKRKVEDK